MLSIAPSPTIYLHAGATEMQKSFDGLSGIIRGSFGGDPAVNAGRKVQRAAG